jgi:hypothetical protein
MFLVNREFKKYLAIEPKNLMFSQDELIKNSLEAKNTPAAERQHPKGQKLQSLPYGFETGSFTISNSFQENDIAD